MAPYVISLLAVEVPLTAAFPFLFVGIVYYICGFNSGAGHYFLAILCGILDAFMGLAFGFFFSTIFKSQKVAFELAPAVFVPFMLVSGQLSNSSKLSRGPDSAAAGDRVHVADQVRLRVLHPQRVRL